MHKAIANALNKNILPMVKRTYDITFTDKHGDLDNDTEFAYTILEAKYQFAQHMAGTGKYKMLTIKMRETIK